MKHLILLAIILSFGCATTFPSREQSKLPVQQIEFTAKQNLINLGLTVLGAGLTVLGNGYILKKASRGVQDGIEDGLNGMHRY